jgi:curved DNA-binding protein CbpA
MRVARPSSDPYSILGIARGADIDQVKAAHRKLAKRYHPDGTTGDEPRFLAVQEAYQLLTDPLRRSDWDRRHAPGPVRADTARRKRTRPGSSSEQAATGAGKSRPRRAARPTAGGAGRKRTWSAERVPWWEDFVPPAQRDGNATKADRGAARDDSAESAPSASSSAQMDFDVFNRSSGAAWSMAARKHFRKGDAELPSRGAWRYRGTQVVTGAEARKVAEEEAAEQAARSTSRRRSNTKDRTDR